MTIVSHRHRLVFVAVPKTATHAIRIALRPELGPEDEEQVALFVQRALSHPEIAREGHGHQGAQTLRRVLGAELWDRYTSFAVVRNPWDRFVSCVAFLMRKTGRFEADPRGTMRRVLDNPETLRRIHFRPQVELVAGESGQQLVEHICRFERLQDDFDDVCGRVGIAPRPLERVNTSRHADYRSYYDDALWDAVGSLYGADVASFGYDER